MMRRTPFISVLMALGTLYISGCYQMSPSTSTTHKKAPNPQTVSQRASHDPQSASQHFINRVKRLNKAIHDSSSNCGLKSSEMIMEMAHALGRKASLLNEPTPVHASETYPTPSQTEMSSLKSHWIQVSDSWSQLWKKYQVIKNSNNKITWKKFSHRFHTLLLEDEKRIFSKTHPYLSRDNKVLVERAAHQIKLCQTHYSCYEYDFSYEIIDYFKASRKHFELWTTYFNSKNRTQQLEALNQLATLVKKDLSRYQFQLSQFIKLVSHNEFILSLNLEGLDEELQSQFFEAAKYWNKDGYKLSIENSPQGALIIDRRALSGHSFVHLGNKSMYLYGHPSIRVLAHELGHVIGFKDHYYTSYDEVSCSYTFEINNSDLMSSVKRGQIYKEHWLTILAHLRF